jgi:exosortase A-associated hydrolase 1
MKFREQPLFFECEGDELLGIVTVPASLGPLGVVIVVGGPQYRVGSHRQFVLLARELAARGVPTLRFDYRGMGDSDGAHPGFEQTGDDIKAAIDAFFVAKPALLEVILWGLCDGGAAAMLYAARDPRVTGLVVLNPWMRTAAGEARAYLRHYYVSRLVDHAFWCKVLTFRFDAVASVRSLAAFLYRALAAGGWSADAKTSDVPEATSATLPNRMAAGLRGFGGPVLLVLSGNDLVAQEFTDRASAAEWRGLLGADRVTRRDLPAANHTFSRAEWRDEVSRLTLSWITANFPPSARRREAARQVTS